MVNGMIEFSSNSEGEKRRGKVRERLVECIAGYEVGESGREVVHGVIE